MKGRSRDNACILLWAGLTMLWLGWMLAFALDAAFGYSIWLILIPTILWPIGLTCLLAAWITWCSGRGQNALWPVLWALFYILLGGGITAWIATHSTNGSLVSGGFFVIVGLFLASQHLNVPDLYEDEEKKKSGQRP